MLILSPTTTRSELSKRRQDDAFLDLCFSFFLAFDFFLPEAFLSLDLSFLVPIWLHAH